MQASEELILNFDKSGVYKIINISNNKFYIGSTKNFKNRYTQHLSKLTKRNHNNNYLLNSYYKYNKNFIMDIVEIVEDLNQLLERESYYISKYNTTNKDIGYNLTTNTFCASKDKEIRNKISKSVKKIMLKELEEHGIWCLDKFKFPKGNIPWNKNKKLSENQTKNFHSKKTITPLLKQAHKNTSIRARNKGNIIICIDPKTNKELYLFRSIIDAVELINNNKEYNFTVNYSRLCKAIKNQNLYKGFYFKKRVPNEGDFIRKSDELLES